MRDAAAQWWVRLEDSPRRVFVVAAVLLCALIGSLWYATPDAAAYLSIARRLAHGAPAHAFGEPQPSYPLGYPLLISPVFLIGDHPLLLLSVINWLLAIAFMLGTYRWFRLVVPDAAVLLTLLVMANINIWNLYRRTLSEALFLPLLMWIAVLTGEALAESKNRRVADLVTIAMLLVWLTATREAGVLVAVAVAATALVSRRGESRSRPLFGAGAIAVAVGLAAVLRPERRAAAINAMRAAFGAGDDALAHILSPLLLGVRRRVVEVAQLNVPGMFKGYNDQPAWWDVNFLVGAIALVVIARGWYLLTKRRADALVILGPLYFAAISLWPYDSARYLLPLRPLFVACAWEAWRPIGDWRRPLIALAVVAHFGVAVGYWWWIDRPRAQVCTAALLDRGGGDTSIGEASACTRIAWQLMLDRPDRDKRGP